MTSYPETINQVMKTFFNTLSEKDKRRYAAVEAQKLGHGGISYMAGVLGCSRTTIHEGVTELNALPELSGDEPPVAPERGRSQRLWGHKSWD